MENHYSEKTPKIVALVPMRHNSERVPQKNYRLFAGKPLFHHIVNRLLECPLISQVVIDTDSQMIKEDVTENFPDIIQIDRPDHLRAGTVPMNDVLLHDVRQVDADYYLQTHSTNPLLHAETITAAIERLISSRSNYDTLFSVTRVQVRLWGGEGKAINHDPSILMRTQDLPPVFEENSCLYIFGRDTIETHKNRIGAKPIMFEIDPVEAWDIDEEMDFRIAEFLYSQQFSEKRELV